MGGEELRHLYPHKGAKMKPTQEQVIAWAREAGFDIERNIWGTSESVHVDGGWITNRLASAFAIAYEAGRKDENEACAVDCEMMERKVSGLSGFAFAAAIRARREQ